MLRVGLTGGIACGKSAVAQMFADLGVYVIQSDQIAHELYRPGEPVYAEVVKRFGQAIVKPGGEIDRAKLASVAFGENRIEELNRIVHPAVIKHQSKWIFEIASKEPDAIAMIEAALIFEAGTDSRFEKMIVVTCGPEQKAARFARRAGSMLLVAFVLPLEPMVSCASTYSAVAARAGLIVASWLSFPSRKSISSRFSSSMRGRGCAPTLTTSR